MEERTMTPPHPGTATSAPILAAEPASASPPSSISTPSLSDTVVPTTLAPRRPPHLTLNSGSGGDILAASYAGSRTTSADNITPPHDIARTATFNTSSEDVSRGSRILINVSRPPSSSGAPASPLVAPIYGASAFTTPEISTDNLLPPPRKARFSGPSDASSRDSSISARSSRNNSVALPLGMGFGYGGAYMNPFSDSRPNSRDDSDADVTAGLLSTSSLAVSSKYAVGPDENLIQYPHEEEKDDYLHNYDPEEEIERDLNFCTPRGALNVGGLALIVLGIIGVFLIWPIVSSVKRYSPHSHEVISDCEFNPDCLADDRPLLMNVRQGLIDPDTPSSAMSKEAQDGTNLKLAFSDEFSKPDRTFYDGDDPYWQAVDIWYGATQDMEWYDPDAASTANGTLNLRFDAYQSHNMNYRSGMLQSWNKMCFKGGRLEASISLPGRGDVVGFWPGFWAMGNLGRPGYLATTDGMWPYSYDDVCDAGITANQSSTDGISQLPGMRLPACTCKSEDHPTPGRSRSAPEIDVIEATVGFLGEGASNATGTVSQSFQAAPFDIWYQPDYDFVEVYDFEITEMNPYRGGTYQQAISGITWLNNEWYDGNAYQNYGFEYRPGKDGEIAWNVGDKYTWKMDGRATRPNGNVGARVLPEEPMSIIFNFGLSNSFSQVFLADLAKLMPATMRVDYVRIYQEEGKESITCDPPGWETTEYIEKHPEPFANPNLTLWKDTRYDWPENTLVHGCELEELAAKGKKRT